MLVRSSEAKESISAVDDKSAKAIPAVWTEGHLDRSREGDNHCGTRTKTLRYLGCAPLNRTVTKPDNDVATLL